MCWSVNLNDPESANTRSIAWTLVQRYHDYHRTEVVLAWPEVVLTYLVIAKVALACYYRIRLLHAFIPIYNTLSCSSYHVRISHTDTSLLHKQLVPWAYGASLLKQQHRKHTLDSTWTLMILP